jgi:glutamine amidotransferase/cyclase
MLYVLDYGAGNVRSLTNCLDSISARYSMVKSADDLSKATALIFPGVGAFSCAMAFLEASGLAQPLRDYINSGRPYFGICIGMQVLYDASDEAPGVKGLGIVPGLVARLSASEGFSVPHMGWNKVVPLVDSPVLAAVAGKDVYFVHSYGVRYAAEGPSAPWVGSVTRHGANVFVSATARGAVVATQFHPEKSGSCGVAMIDAFVRSSAAMAVGGSLSARLASAPAADAVRTSLTRRVVACLDVRENDRGDLVVTKGDQYDVREKDGDKDVRNLGKPVELASRYAGEGADEVTFLNITSFRNCPIDDIPMLKVLELASERIFVPLCVGGGIRDMVDGDGKVVFSAGQIAARYFRAGADKVSLGSDAVLAAEAYLATGVRTGLSSIEQIAKDYGTQAVVISVDPKRVYVASPSDTKHSTLEALTPGPNGERWCWYQVTLKGGRETRDMDVIQLVTACEALGAGEVLLNCIDHDGSGLGFDTPLISHVKAAVKIPVIASSGAGSARHFVEVFNKTGCDAALAAGIFHRNEVSIEQVKAELAEANLPVRRV